MDPSLSVWVIDFDPSVAPGLPALLGERSRQDPAGTVWFKIGPLDTDWALSPGGGGIPSAPSNATYWVSSANATLTAEVNMGALASGIVYQTVAIGVSTPAIVSIGTGLTFIAPTLDRAALSGDVSASAGSNTLTLATVNASPGTYTNATVTVNAKGLATTVVSGATPAPVGATYITQTPDATLTNEQALSLLGTGVLSSTTATGVVASTTFTAGSVPFGAASILSQDNANFFYDSANVRWGFGTNSPTSSATATWERSVAGPMGHFVHNGNAGAGQALVMLQTAASATFATTPYMILSATGAGFVPVGAIAGSSGYIEHNGGTMSIGAVTGDIVFYSGAGRTEKARIANAGNVSVANLTAGGVTYATAATGVLKIGTAAEVAAAITWPADNLILISTGTTTAPEGKAGFNYEGANDIVELSDDVNLAHYNLGSSSTGNYERVRMFWTGNQWFLQSEAGGTGTVRGMRIDSGTAGLTLQAGAAGMAITSGGALSAVGTWSLTSANVTVTSETGGTGHNLTIVGNNSDGQFFVTAWDSASILTRGNSGFSADFISEGATVQGSPTLASSASLVLDAIRLSATATVTGTTTITTAAGFNFVTVPRPSVAKGDAGALTITNSASVYIENHPLAGTDVTITNRWALWVDGGKARFDGDGTNVFELPADATAGVDTTIDGRIPILVGGTTKYIRYYAD